MRSHPVDPQRILRSLLTERWQSRTTVVLVSLAAAILGLIAPYSQKQFVDLLTRGHPSLHWIWIAFGSALGYQCLNQLALWLSSRESVYSQKALGEALFSRMLAVRGGLIGHRPAGEAVSLFAVDVPGAAGILDQCLSTGASLFFPILLAPLALRHFFGIPLGASLGAITAIGGVNVVLALRQSRFFYRFKQLAAERTGLVAEWVGNIRTLRILGWTESVEQRIFAVRQRETRNRIAMVTNGQLMNSIAGSATYVVNVLAVAALVRLRGTGVTPGELLALLWILGVFLARPLRQFPWFFVIGLDAISSIRRLQAALAVESPSPRI